MCKKLRWFWPQNRCTITTSFFIACQLARSNLCLCSFQNCQNGSFSKLSGIWVTLPEKTETFGIFHTRPQKASICFYTLNNLEVNTVIIPKTSNCYASFCTFKYFLWFFPGWWKTACSWWHDGWSAGTQEGRRFENGEMCFCHVL